MKQWGLRHLLCVAIVVLSGCTAQSDFIQTRNTNSTLWTPAQTIAFSFKPGTPPHTMTILVRHGLKYNHSTLPLTITTTLPNKKFYTETIQLPLTDTHSQWIGRRVGPFVDMEYPYRAGITFPDSTPFITVTIAPVNAVESINYIGLTVTGATSLLTP